MNATLAMSASSLRQRWGEPSAAQQAGERGRTLACTRAPPGCYRPVAMGTKMIVEGLAGLQALVGKSLGTTEWNSHRYESSVASAHAAGDPQWIHGDRERCMREAPDGVRIARGCFTLSRVAGLFFELA